MIAVMFRHWILVLGEPDERLRAHPVLRGFNSLRYAGMLDHSLSEL
jgi:hypothetical protein